MSENNEKKRQIPRHVDGRIKIFDIITLKNFLILLPIDLVLITLLFKAIVRFKQPFLLLIGMAFIGAVSMLFLEFKFRETGLDVIRETITSFKRGNIYTERGIKK